MNRRYLVSPHLLFEKETKMSSDEEEVTIFDGDTCGADELASSFKHTYNISCEEAVSLKKSYILHLNNSRLVNACRCGECKHDSSSQSPNLIRFI